VYHCKYRVQLRGGEFVGNSCLMLLCRGAGGLVVGSIDLRSWLILEGQRTYALCERDSSKIEVPNHPVTYQYMVETNMKDRSSRPPSIRRESIMKKYDLVRHSRDWLLIINRSLIRLWKKYVFITKL
jgi:hypothetical protein